jgi:hypothetical protein
MCIHCRRNMITEPLPNNGHLFWLHYSGILGETHRQQGDIISLLLFFSNKESRLKMVHHITHMFTFFIQPFACCELIRIAWHTCVTIPTAKEISSMLINYQSISVNRWHQKLYSEGRRGFHTSYICGHLKVICWSHVGFCAQRHLSPSSLGISSKYFYGGARKSKSQNISSI